MGYWPLSGSGVWPDNNIAGWTKTLWQQRGLLIQ